MARLLCSAFEPVDSASRTSFDSDRRGRPCHFSTSIICSPTVRTGLRLVIGSCMIMLISLPRREWRSASESESTSSPL
ncbi:hypothetical protein D320_01628 [Haloferax sp. BAB-2207]|nr:hypothetical protein D320_01628 [Haloferax sp. BAB-2207]